MGRRHQKDEGELQLCPVPRCAIPGARGETDASIGSLVPYFESSVHH